MRKTQAAFFVFWLTLVVQVNAQTATSTLIELSDTEVSQTLNSKVLISLEILEQRLKGPIDYKHRGAVDLQGNCQVHHTPLHEEHIPISYGLRPAKPKKLKEAEEKRFPNAALLIEQGCLVMPAKEAIVWHCPRCVVERENWQRRYQH